MLTLKILGYAFALADLAVAALLIQIAFQAWSSADRAHKAIMSMCVLAFIVQAGVVALLAWKA